MSRSPWRGVLPASSSAVRSTGLRAVLALAVAAGTTGCVVLPAEPPTEDGAAVGQAPERFTIAPDDYHVPYAGTAEDGRKFFLSEELFDGDSAYVGVFLWNADGTFDEVQVDAVPRAEGLPPGQAGSSGAEDLVEARLAELGEYVLEPIEVEPFTQDVDGVTFGWNLDQYEDGTYFINVMPGDFIAYYEPWDGLGYDT
ncbi:hypothetical protein ACIGB8_05970 [Promicromonospora sukumoe]|uniref:hypothetical protein n=1 Tax=Promicromonospora sukumoe TaxID=88382 RepID=UPI0037C6605F